MSSPSPAQLLRKRFPFDPTAGQERLFQALDSFLLDDKGERPVLLLKGYAGTGKTTAISALVQVLPRFNYRYVLMAPTGRAAKVMVQYARRTAFTIHKKIYKQTSDPAADESLSFSLQKNYSERTLFIVDEASMLSDTPDVGRRGLLRDLFDYVFSTEGNRLLLIGDGAQLPPVHQAESPALDAGYLQQHLRADVLEVELTDVMRQQQESGILYNATELRKLLQEQTLDIQFKTKEFKDIFRMTGERLEDGLRYAYDKYGRENAIIVCRSNKAALQYNQYIRRSIQYSESELDAGDFLMIVRNNYLFLPEDSPGNFLANGDFVEVMKIVRFEEIYGFRFADVEMRLLDEPDTPPFEAKLLLDCLYAPQASLDQADFRRLYEAVKEDYADLATKKDLREALRKDPYLNALQVKFAYALTCHKAQGGQWDAVFVDQGYLNDDMLNREYIRWLYTAVTRSTKELFLVNFNRNFFA